jgi:hypothetical protein
LKSYCTTSKFSSKFSFVPQSKSGEKPEVYGDKCFIEFLFLFQTVQWISADVSKEFTVVDNAIQQVNTESHFFLEKPITSIYCESSQLAELGYCNFLFVCFCNCFFGIIGSRSWVMPTPII